MNVCIHAQGCGHAIIGHPFQINITAEPHIDRNLRTVEQGGEAGAVQKDREARPGCWQLRGFPVWDVANRKRPRSASFCRCQDYPMAVPDNAVISRITVTIFIIERRIIKTRVTGSRHRQNSGAAFKANRGWVQRGGQT